MRTREVFLASTVVPACTYTGKYLRLECHCQVNGPYLKDLGGVSLTGEAFAEDLDGYCRRFLLEAHTR